MPKKVMKASKTHFPPPKKGKARAFKKPAAVKKKSKVSYVRHGVMTFKTRVEQAKWCCSLKEIYSTPEQTLVESLQQQGILRKWESQACPFCEFGKLSALREVGGRGLRYKCGSKACRRYVIPHHLHPVFLASDGKGHVPLRDQAAVLFCAVANMKRTAAHLATGKNHKFIDGIYNRLDEARAVFVEEKQEHIDFGAGGDWPDVEADEADLRKTT